MNFDRKFKKSNSANFDFFYLNYKKKLRKKH